MPPISFFRLIQYINGLSGLESLKCVYTHMAMNTRQFTLHEILTQGFHAVNRELAEIKRAIELLAKTTTLDYHNIEALKMQVASLAEGLAELEQRLVVLEQHVGVQKWLVRQSVTVAVAVAIIVVWTWLT